MDIGNIFELTIPSSRQMDLSFLNHNPCSPGRFCKYIVQVLMFGLSKWINLNTTNHTIVSAYITIGTISLVSILYRV